jgi:anthranilate phosphoribosyltransferase
VARCLDELGIGFLFAPRFHPAMKHAAPVRQEIGMRTIFNILGPLTNPASASVQLLGVYEPRLAQTLARVLGLLGTRHALVVHGADGLDELSTTGPNLVAEMDGGQLKSYELDPVQLGLPRASLDQLRGGSVEHNADITMRLLQGEKGPQRDIVVLNAAAALAAAGKAEDLESGLTLAAQAIDTGAASQKLRQLVELSQSLRGEEG